MTTGEITQLTDAAFRMLFQQTPSLLLVLNPQLHIVAATDSYLAATMTARAEVLGRHIFDVFPDNPLDPRATGVANLHASLQRVLRHHVADTMAVQRYDVRRPAGEGGGFETRYWSPRNTPVLDDAGRLVYIIHQAEDITDYVRTRYPDQTETVAPQHAYRLHAQLIQRSQELQDANQALRDADTAKNEFLSRASHELRTPLNTVLGFAHLLSLAQVDEQQADWIQLIIKAGRHLLGLLNDVLDISRVESGHLALSVESLALGPALAEAVNLVCPQADTHRVNVAPPPALPDHVRVAADQQRLRQVLINLLSNAIKFNKPGGDVTITVVTDQPHQRVDITVTDTGRGIPPDGLDKLFTPFERLDAPKAGIEGTGLGLTLSRYLVHAMNGTLTVTSHPGTGSAFTVSLPAANPEAAPAPVRDQPLIPPARHTGPKRLLYVEDVAENLLLVRQILTHRPAITLVPTALGATALDLARAQRPDLVLLDLHLPDLPGEEVLRRLRADPTTREVPVVILTADATPLTAHKMLAAGAAAHLTKPIDIPTLITTIDQLLAPEVPGR